MTKKMRRVIGVVLLSIPFVAIIVGGGIMTGNGWRLSVTVAGIVVIVVGFLSAGIYLVTRD